MKEKKLTKFDALRILGNAYWYVRDIYGNADTADILHDKFGYIRRSLIIADLAPQLDIEGWNPKGPTHF